MSISFLSNLINLLKTVSKFPNSLNRETMLKTEKKRTSNFCRHLNLIHLAILFAKKQDFANCSEFAKMTVTVGDSALSGTAWSQQKLVSDL